MLQPKKLKNQSAPNAVHYKKLLLGPLNILRAMNEMSVKEVANTAETIRRTQPSCPELEYDHFGSSASYPTFSTFQFCGLLCGGDFPFANRRPARCGQYALQPASCMEMGTKLLNWLENRFGNAHKRGKVEKRVQPHAPSLSTLKPCISLLSILGDCKSCVLASDVMFRATKSHWKKYVAVSTEEVTECTLFSMLYRAVRLTIPSWQEECAG